MEMNVRLVVGVRQRKREPSRPQEVELRRTAEDGCPHKELYEIPES
jgi:hypothetical protein